MPREKIDASSVERANGRQRSYVAHCRRVVASADAGPPPDGRCPVCTHSGRIGGATCSYRPCGQCETVLCSGNTCVDVLCRECADRLGLCRQCGADRELKHRRKPRSFAT